MYVELLGGAGEGVAIRDVAAGCTDVLLGPNDTGGPFGCIGGGNGGAPQGGDSAGYICKCSGACGAAGHCRVGFVTGKLSELSLEEDL